MSGLPPEFLQSIQHITGFNESAFVEAHGSPPPASVRLHPLKGTGVYTMTEQVPWCNEGRYLDKRPIFTLDPLFHAGAYYVQEASSMFLDYLIRTILPERKGLRVLDLCAAPGGKSTLIASLLGPESLLISNEVIRTRAGILEENMTRWGYANTWVTSNDARDFGKLRGYFDLIVVDAPCSGSGLFRKDADAIKEWSTANVQLCAERQQRILADVWPALKQDGVLIYATCSYSHEEDEGILAWLADSFDVEPLTPEVRGEWGIVPTSAPGDLGGYRFFPDKVKGEGFFIAAVRKKTAEQTAKPAKFKSAHNKSVYQQCKHLVSLEDVACVEIGDGSYSLLQAAHEADMQLLSKYVYLRKAGLQAGSPAAKEWLPAHDIAPSVDRASELPSLELTKEQALLFLKKEEPAVPVPAKGWYVAQYDGLGLGWVKSLGNRFNNYLPKNLRIRMDIAGASE